MVVPIIFAVACILSASFFIWTEYKWEKKRTLLIKGISSLLFTAVGISGYLIYGAGSSYGLWIIAALIMGLIGDLFLGLPDTRRRFVYGLVTFLIGHIIYGIVFYKFNGFEMYDILIYIDLLGVSAFVYNKGEMHLGIMKIPALIYTAVIVFMYTAALSSIYKGGFNNITTILVAVGASFFITSDTILAYGRFHENAKPYLRGMDLALYYCGQVMLALSVMTFGAS